MGVLQARGHLPLVHLQLQGIHLVNVPGDSEEHTRVQMTGKGLGGKGLRSSEELLSTLGLCCPKSTAVPCRATKTGYY